MKKIRAAIVGYGNIGSYVLEALQAAPDFEVGIAMGFIKIGPNDIVTVWVEETALMLPALVRSREHIHS